MTSLILAALLIPLAIGYRKERQFSRSPVHIIGDYLLPRVDDERWTIDKQPPYGLSPLFTCGPVQFNQSSWFDRPIPFSNYSVKIKIKEADYSKKSPIDWNPQYITLPTSRKLDRYVNTVIRYQSSLNSIKKIRTEKETIHKVLNTFHELE